jgi:hypothetical protein
MDSMRLKVVPDQIDEMLKIAGCEVTVKGERLIAAIKPVNYGRLHIRLRRPNRPYEAAYYWYCDVYFKYGLGFNRSFDSKEVRSFLETYITPFKFTPKESSKTK